MDRFHQACSLPLRQSIQGIQHIQGSVTVMAGMVFGWLSLLSALSGCSSEPRLTELHAQVKVMNEQQQTLKKEQQQILEHLSGMESKLDEHDFLVGELIRTEEEASLDTHHLLDKLERSSSSLREQIDQTRAATQRRDQDLSIRIKAIEARLENLVQGGLSRKPLESFLTTDDVTKNPRQHPSASRDKQNPSLDQVTVNQASAFRSAYKAYLNGRYKMAAAQFLRFVEKFPAASLTPQAYYYLGDAQYIQKDYQAAAQTFRQVLTHYPDDHYVPPAMYKLGLVLRETDEISKAQQLWNQIIRDYPDLPEAALAQEQLAKARIVPE